MTGDPDHGYGVRAIAASRGFEITYRPWCECGWVGVDDVDESAAADAAFTHATGKDPTVDSPRRHRGPRQAEVIFDAAPFER